MTINSQIKTYIYDTDTVISASKPCSDILYILRERKKKKQRIAFLSVHPCVSLHEDQNNRKEEKKKNKLANEGFLLVYVCNGVRCASA